MNDEILSNILDIVRTIVLFILLIGTIIQNDKLHKEVHYWKIKYYESVTGEEIEGLK